MGHSHIVAVVNPQPGVGKTTVAVNLAAVLVGMGHPTMLIDLDPRADASRALGVNLTASSRSVYAVLRGEARLPEVRLPTISGIDLVAGHSDLSELAADADHPEFMALSSRLQDVAGEYAYVLFDCPSQLNRLVRHALDVAQRIIVPFQPGASASAAMTLDHAHQALAVSFVANKAAPGSAGEHPEPLVSGKHTTQLLGIVHYSPRLQEMDSRGLPPVVRGPEDDVTRDFTTLAVNFVDQPEIHTH